MLPLYVPIALFLEIRKEFSWSSPRVRTHTLRVSKLGPPPHTKGRPRRRSKLGLTIPLSVRLGLRIAGVGEKRLPRARIRGQVERRHSLLVLGLERCARVHERPYRVGVPRRRGHVQRRAWLGLGLGLGLVVRVRVSRRRQRSGSGCIRRGLGGHPDGK